MINHHFRPGSWWQLSLAVALVTVLTLVSALAGCGGDDTETGTEDETSATDQSGGGSGGSDDETPPDDTAGTGQSTNELAEGSGCTPGTETGLSDGRWYGFIASVNNRRVDFDLACFFTGAAAEAAATEDGEGGPPNGFYVRNVNPLIRSLDVAADAMVTWFPDIGNPDSEEAVTFDEWVTGRAGRAGDSLRYGSKPKAAPSPPSRSSGWRRGRLEPGRSPPGRLMSE